MADEFDPRVHITNGQTGEQTPVRRDELLGVDEFMQSIQVDTELPPEFRFSGWQESDEEHPPGDGRPAYRVVFKTLRTVPTRPAAVVSSNCRVMFANDQVTWGEPRFGRALHWRRPDRYLVPDWGRVYYGPLRYVRDANNTIPMEAHQDTTPPMNFVEILYVLHEDAAGKDHHSRLGAARSAVAPLLASIDLCFGPRLLGIRITEEIGEVFDDWHWNRRLDGPTVALEAQAELRYVDGDTVADQIATMFDANSARSEEDRARLRIAAQWYWRADAEVDPVQEFIAHWLTIEALEMDSPDIAPVKRVVHKQLGGDPAPIAVAVGRLHGLRSKLVHGKTRAVSSRQLTTIRAVSLALLERRLVGIMSTERRKALREAIAEGNLHGFSNS